MSKFYNIITMIIITAASAAADQVHLRSESDAYPRGYYDGDRLPEKTVYLTFDDGPSDWTEGILDVLKQENVKATFFVCAYWNNRKIKGESSFEKHRNALMRINREGHVLGNHTYGHRVIARLPSSEINKQLSYNQDALNKALGKDAPVMTIIRPPLGMPWSVKSSKRMKEYTGSIVRKTGIVAMWTKKFDSTDSWNWARGEWFKPGARVDENNPSFMRKKEKIYKRLTARADGNGMVVLMHDTHLVTRDVLPPLIKELKRRGYRFCTMEEFVMWKYGKSSRELLGTK